MGARFILYRDNDNVIEFESERLLTDEITGNVIAAAANGVTVRLLDTDGTTELMAAVAMSAVGGEAGNYRATIPDDAITWENYEEVFAEVVADDGPGRRGKWLLPCDVETRRGIRRS